MFDTQIAEILDNLEVAHSTYYESEVFGGPSLFFHIKSLNAAQRADPECFSEYSYATLASWGMHRMGRGGSKMREYEEYSASVRTVWPMITVLQRLRPADLGESEWNSLRNVFAGIHVMATGTSLVGNSKVMAHALPGLIPPVDREYTLKYLYGNGNIQNNLEKEWRRLRTIIEHFFHPIASSDAFQFAYSKWQRERHLFKWDTSPLKAIDNLVIGMMKKRRAATTLR